MDLLQKIIQEHWNGGELGLASTNKAGSETNLEAAFREASSLAPERLDLRFGIASSLMQQALQTNGAQLKLKVDQALEVYRQIGALHTNNFEAGVLYAAFARAIGRTNESAAKLTLLMAIDPRQTEEYLQAFKETDQILELCPNEKPPRHIRRVTNHAIVILGAGLETNGTVKPKLVGRLKQGLKLAKVYRASPIVLTGGNPKAGVTEALAMKQWLIHHGLKAKRLRIEDHARDTVENALFSAVILQKLGVNRVSLVTSVSHTRRALGDFEQACRKLGLQVQFDCLASTTKGETFLNAEQERLGVYRDTLRAMGLWAFPGLRR